MTWKWETGAGKTVQIHGGKRSSGACPSASGSTWEEAAPFAPESAGCALEVTSEVALAVDRGHSMAEGIAGGGTHTKRRVLPPTWKCMHSQRDAGSWAWGGQDVQRGLRKASWWLRCLRGALPNRV